MVSARQNGTALFAGLKGLRGSSCPPPVQSISTTSTIKVRPALHKVNSQKPRSSFSVDERAPGLGCYDCSIIPSSYHLTHLQKPWEARKYKFIDPFFGSYSFYISFVRITFLFFTGFVILILATKPGSEQDWQHSCSLSRGEISSRYTVNTRNYINITLMLLLV